jgi:hypothetical protein
MIIDILYTSQKDLLIKAIENDILCNEVMEKMPGVQGTMILN